MNFLSTRTFHIALFSTASVAVLLLLAIGATPPPTHTTDQPAAAGGTDTIGTDTAVSDTIHTPARAEYLQVTSSCDAAYVGDCVNVRTGPGEDYPVVTRLRTGVVLKIAEAVVRDARTWYRIAFDEWLRYPGRVTSDWYVAAELVETLLLEEPQELNTSTETSSSSKRIIVDRSEEMLYAYEGDVLFMEESVSTGIEITPTPRGTFTVFRKTPSRYMQGPLPGISSKYYDLPGVPWNLYFTHQGAVIHGTYWHDNFGQAWSNGCVNITPERARILYEWAEVGTTVIVQD